MSETTTSTECLRLVQPRAATPLWAPCGELLVIEPTPSRPRIRLREVWAYRDLLYFLVRRDIKVRYRQTALGVLWALLQPLMTMTVFSVLFGRFAGFNSLTVDVPYSLFVFAGMLPWLYFSTAVSAAMASITNNQNLFTKVYFCRLVAPFAAVGPGLVDLGVSLLLLAGMMPWWGLWPSWRLIVLPLILFFVLLLALGVGAALSALTVRYRDFRHVVPFALQLWFYSSCIVYPLGLLPERGQWLMGLNPLVGLVGGFRFAVLGSDPAWNWRLLLLSCSVSVVVFAAGTRIFRRLERSFADDL
jgi:lipopolysaccharide transport system permease protein